MSVFALRRDAFPFLSALLSITICASLLLLLVACGASTDKSKNTSPPPPAPPQPNYPAIPPEPITWTPKSQFPAPPAEDQTKAPWKDGSNDFPLSVASPLTNTTVSSPLTVIANANPKNPIFFMRVYVDSLAVYYTFNNSINTQIFLSSGPHTLTVMAEDRQGYISATPLQITVSGQATSTNGQTVISNIEDMPGWQSCGALFPTGSGRDGQICAAGGGTPNSTITQNVSSPAMDGTSAKFSMAPVSSTDCPHYCNMLYFNAVAGGDNVSHFIYDLYFYIDNPSAPQALEFDVNQTFGGQRWVWGSECSFDGSGFWDIWNDVTGWQPTTIPCKPFPANQWIHLVWKVERVGNQVHYISLTVGDQTYNVDTYYPNQPGWTLEEIDAAFQMDLDGKGTPYNVWLDKVNLTAY